MSATPVAKRLVELIAAKLDRSMDEIRETSQFVADLGADSLDLVELIMAIENEFEIEIPDEDAEKISSVRDAIEYVEKHSKA
jgi:acyl carrier protein